MKQRRKKIKSEEKSPYFKKESISNVASPYFQNVVKFEDTNNTVSKYFISTKKSFIKSEGSERKIPLKEEDWEEKKLFTENSVLITKNRKTISYDIETLANMKPIVYVPKFVPMSSPYNLVQETLYYDPWKLLVATTFLNRTKGTQAFPIMWKFLEEYSTPQKTIKVGATKIADLLHPLGLQNIRAERLIKFSLTYLANPDFSTPKELFGMGQYAEDSWRLFCGEEDDAWMEGSGLEPTDKMLKMYINWRRVVHKGYLKDNEMSIDDTKREEHSA
ncbi:7862_t:CDS:2 [Diversispora eburnea]|uniref:Methyl-CpG-binding domain protein 4 n=1 Tax=Diversispora eburnea TaxID=1213867 RepID=A0A9N9DF78_9GLOM|nr:7862_t:CDS:2 [Diversispora eburnea]